MKRTPTLAGTVTLLALAAVALAGCNTYSPRTRASAECWMSIEKSHPRMSLDKRSDIVNKCIDDKMKQRRFF
jgi:hypothetical protein